MTMLDRQPEDLPLDLNLLAQIQMEDSRSWFPYLHTGRVNLLDFYLKGMTGELGEFANVMKKIERLEAKATWIADQTPYANQAADLELCRDELEDLWVKAKAEHTDILCYWLLVGAVMGHNLEASWRANRHTNATRWGG